MSSHRLSKLDRTSYHFTGHDNHRSVRSTPLGSEDFNTSKASELNHEHEGDFSVREEERRIRG